MNMNSYYVYSLELYLVILHFYVSYEVTFEQDLFKYIPLSGVSEVSWVLKCD